MSNITFTHPYDEASARDGARMAASLQAGAEGQVRDASSKLAKAEETYRIALSKEMFRLHQDEGVGWSTCEVIAKGTDSVAKLRYARDVAAGVLEAAKQEGWRRNADRKDMHQLIEWSMRKDLGASYGNGSDEPIAFTAKAA